MGFIGKKYKLPVVDSFLEFSHGMYRYIEEIYIPELGIAFNEEGHVFKASEDRYAGFKFPSGREVEAEFLGEVEVPSRDAKEFTRFVELKEKLRDITGKYFKKAPK